MIPNRPGTYFPRALGALVPYIVGTWEVRGWSAGHAQVSLGERKHGLGDSV